MARDLNLEASLWYFFTSPEFYEMAAKECEDLRDMFSGAAKVHGKTTYKRNGQIHDAFNTAARNFKRGAGFARLEEYNVIYDAAGSVQSDIRGMTQWSSPDVWMDDAEREAFHRGTGRVLVYHELIQHSLANGLKGGAKYISPTNVYKDRDNGFRDSSIISKFAFYNTYYDFGWQVPSPLPQYKVDKSISVKTTELCPITGAWYPVVGLERHSLVFGIKGYPMPAAFFCDKTMEELSAESKDGEVFTSDIETIAVDTTWHPVKLVEPANDSETPIKLMRCNGGEPCPGNGYWWTPAKPGAGREFKQGEIMPKFQSDYGATIWQWSSDHSEMQ